MRLIGIAHPVKDIKDLLEMEVLVTQGIDFMEIQPQLRAKFDYQPFELFAQKNHLPVSFGSDYHGPTMDRQLLKRDENMLSPGLAKLLNLGA